MSDLAERLAKMAANEKRQAEMFERINALLSNRAFEGFPKVYEALRSIQWSKGEPPSEQHLRVLANNIVHNNLEPMRMGEFEEDVEGHAISIVWAECRGAA